MIGCFRCSLSQSDEELLSHVFARPARHLSKTTMTNGVSSPSKTNNQSPACSGSHDCKRGSGLDDNDVFVSDSWNGLTDSSNVYQSANNTQTPQAANTSDLPSSLHDLSPNQASLTPTKSCKVNNISRSTPPSVLLTDESKQNTERSKKNQHFQKLRRFTRRFYLRKISLPKRLSLPNWPCDNNLNILMRFSSKIIKPLVTDNGSIPGSFRYTVDRSTVLKPVATQGIHFGLPSALFAVPAVAKQR